MVGSRFRGNDVGEQRSGELESALRGLGFRVADARRAVKQVLASAGAHVGLEELLRAALVLLAPS